MAVAAHARSAIATIEVALGRPVHIIRDHEIESAIVVIVEPCRARCPPARVRDCRARRHIGERSVTIVVIEDAASVAAQEEIRVSVVVKITDGDTHAE